MKTLFLAALLSCAAALSAADSFADVSHDELLAAVKEKKAVIIDVNGSESYAAGHIPGALDWQAVKGDLAKHLPADKSTLVVAYCGNEQCGAYKQAAKAAQDLGYTNVKHYSKGIAGYKTSGAPIETAKKGDDGKLGGAM
jgi:rhodanese-related sulfurtransferase